MTQETSPTCGHSACRQYWIESGCASCVQHPLCPEIHSGTECCDCEGTCQGPDDAQWLRFAWDDLEVAAPFPADDGPDFEALAMDDGLDPSALESMAASWGRLEGYARARGMTVSRLLTVAGIPPHPE